MKKALYLVIVFVLPVFTLLFPGDLFQAIWVWVYIPLATIYAIFIWFRPNQHMMTLVTLTPVIFLLSVLIIFPCMAAMDSGAYQGLQFLGVVAIIAIPSSVVIGAPFVLAAFGIYALFRKYGLLPHSS